MSRALLYHIEDRNKYIVHDIEHKAQEDFLKGWGKGEYLKYV